MSLSAGTRLGPYEITGAIGAGGMGEVYQARDTRLNRTVAIKVLPRELSGDAQRRARLEREARALASLSHPRICPLFDVGEHDGSTFLVMELLHGDTLAERLKRGPVPLGQALEIAVQIAEGLDAAHKRGIVHRDLKPGNVVLTKTGATLLDFGLAKARADGEYGRNASTETDPVTRAGAVVGTLQYMAPEQLEGKEVDGRADLWALGAMLYEMASGARPFRGDSSASLTAAILGQEPAPISVRLPIAPPSLDRVVRRCLAKSAEERWESAKDLADNLRWIAQDIARGEPEAMLAARPPWRRAWPMAVMGLSGLLLGAGLLWVIRPGATPAPQPVIRSLLDVRPADEVRSAFMPRGETRTPGGSLTAFAWTPDGRALVFAGMKGDTRQLFVRQLEGGDSRPLPDTAGALGPVVSADGQWVAYWTDGAIRKVALAGGPATVIAEGYASPPAGMDWGGSGLLVFDGGDGRIWRARAGSKPEAVTTLGEGEVEHLTPHLLPGDNSVLFTVRRRDWTWGDEEVVAQVLDSGKRTVLLRNATDARYVPPGRLVFMRQGTLFAVPFDPGRLEVRGEEVALLDGVAQALTAANKADVTGAGQLAVSPAGDLAFISSPLVPSWESRLVTVDRTGRVEQLPAPARSYGMPALSPDGRQLAVSIFSTTELGVSIFDLARHTLTKLTPPGGEFIWPRWTPDGLLIAFRSLQSGIRALAWQRSDGSAPPALLAREAGWPSSWSPDGRELALVKDDGIWVLDVKGNPPKLRPVAQAPDSAWPAFSPDGRWLLYAGGADENQVYLQPYPGPGPRLQVSVERGFNPTWNPNGREIFFLAPGRTDPDHRSRLMAVRTQLGSTAVLGVPHELFEFNDGDWGAACSPLPCYAVAPDGQRFFGMQRVKSEPPPPVTHINLVLNWRAELEAKVPSGL